MNFPSAAPQEVPCKVCQMPARFFGALDFNRNCLEGQGVVLPTYGFAVYYRRCTSCGFLFTDSFDDWSQSDFSQHIYNNDYIKVDPGYDTVRPTKSADMVASLLAPRKDNVSILDFGGGNGKFAECMRSAGFSICDTYDPFSSDFSTPPQRQYDVVTCFEVLEHTPGPLGTAATISGFLNDNGVVIFSTLVQPENFDQVGLSWWYVGPRNGHISIHSARSLELLWKTIGFSVSSPSSGLHLAYRIQPSAA